MIRPSNRLRFIRRVLYRLKRDYGSVVDIYYEPSDTVDLITGNRSVTKQKWTVNRGICLPTTIRRDSIFGAAVLAAFKYGGTLELGDKTVLIDRQDLPNGFLLGTENWYMVINSRRYEIVNVKEYEDQAAYYVVLKYAKGTQLGQIVDMTVRDQLTVTLDPGGNDES